MKFGLALLFLLALSTVTQATLLSTVATMPCKFFGLGCDSSSSTLPLALPPFGSTCLFEQDRLESRILHVIKICSPETKTPPNTVLVTLSSDPSKFIENDLLVADLVSNLLEAKRNIDLKNHLFGLAVKELNEARILVDDLKTDLRFAQSVSYTRGVTAAFLAFAFPFTLVVLWIVSKKRSLSAPINKAPEPLKEDPEPANAPKAPELAKPFVPKLPVPASKNHHKSDFESEPKAPSHDLLHSHSNPIDQDLVSEPKVEEKERPKDSDLANLVSEEPKVEMPKEIEMNEDLKPLWMKVIGNGEWMKDPWGLNKPKVMEDPKPKENPKVEKAEEKPMEEPAWANSEDATWTKVPTREERIKAQKYNKKANNHKKDNKAASKKPRK